MRLDYYRFTVVDIFLYIALLRQLKKLQFAQPNDLESEVSCLDLESEVSCLDEHRQVGKYRL